MRKYTLFLALILNGLLPMAQNSNQTFEGRGVISETQTINLNQGWTGISSYLDPSNPEVASLMSAIEEQLIILRDFEGNYYQPASKSTLINWDVKEGYFIKMVSAGNLEIQGLYPLSRQFDLQAGWNLIPALSDVPVLIEDYFYDHLEKVEIVTEVAGVNVFWQEMNIFTLETLLPGKAYLVKAVAPFNLFQLPEVVTLEVTDITSTTATCGGEVLHEGSSAVIERGVVWSTYENPTIEEYEGILYNGTGMGSWLSELTGLVPQTNYFIRAFAGNHVGTAYGEQLSFLTQQQGVFTCGISTITDADGNIYNTVLVGEQCWMKENLKTTRDAGGNNILRYCYNNVANNCNLYGGLYTWTTMMNGAGSSNTNPSGVQGICPTGWHLPSNAEWTQLVDYVVSQGYPNDMFNANGAGNSLKSCRQVNSPLGGYCNTSDHPRWNSNESHYGFDEFDFSGLPGGKRGNDGIFTTLGQWSNWWTTNEDFSSNAWGNTLNYGSGSLGGTSINKGSGFSVRCLKNDGTGPTTYDLNLEVNPSGAGTVIGEGQYEAGGQVNITADANTGWEFVNWTDEDGTEVSALPSFSYTMPAEDITLTANFEEETAGFTCGETLVDVRDGQEYETVQIGNQCWMKENLNIGTRIDGSSSQANDGTIEKYCYDNLESNCNIYGGLYQWNEMMGYTNTAGVEGICPDGWHLPTNAEWTDLTTYLGGEGVAGGKMKATGTTYWNNPNIGATNSSGFTGLPGGNRADDANFSSIGSTGLWWSSTKYSTTIAWYRGLGYALASVTSYHLNQERGFSVRCLKNDGTGPTTYDLNLEVNPSGTGTVNGAGQYEAGEQVNITAEANEGWDFINWTDEDGTEVSVLANFTYTMPVEDITLTANFEEETAGFTCGETLVDVRDGQQYETVQIGNQCWMAENLNIGTRIDGSSSQANNGVFEKYCLDNIDANCVVYGGLYQWQEMMGYSTNPGTQGICPEGWHLPTDAEWTILTDYVSSQSEYLCNNNTLFIAKALAATTNWYTSSYTCAVGNNQLLNNATGFTVLPGGIRDSYGTFFHIADNVGYFWSSTVFETTYARSRTLQFSVASIGRSVDTQDYGFSVRCLKDY